MIAPPRPFITNSQGARSGVDALQGRPSSVGDFSHRGQFEILKELHQSNCGSVHLARLKEQGARRHRHVILKKCRLPELGRAKDLLNEYELLKQLQHPNIIGCHGYFWEEQSQSLFIVLEYADRGDLYKEVQSRSNTRQHFTNDEVWDIFAQLLFGVHHMHGKGIVHRDIKSLNIFLTACGTVKIGDFGVSRQMSEHTLCLNSFYGTPLYLSPEVVEGRAYTQSTDIWSLGVVLYELLTLEPPFNGTNLRAVVDSVLAGCYAPPPSFRPKELVALVADMLRRDPSHRPTTAELVRRLERLGKLASRRSDVAVEHAQPPAPSQATTSQVVGVNYSRSSGKSPQHNGLNVPSTIPQVGARNNCGSLETPPQQSAPNIAANSTQSSVHTATAGAQADVQVVRVRRRPSSAAPSFASRSSAQGPCTLGGVEPNRIGTEQVAAVGSDIRGANGEDCGGGRANAPTAAKSLRESRWEERRRAHASRVSQPEGAGNGCPEHEVAKPSDSACEVDRVDRRAGAVARTSEAPGSGAVLTVRPAENAAPLTDVPDIPAAARIRASSARQRLGWEGPPFGRQSHPGSAPVPTSQGVSAVGFVGPGISRSRVTGGVGGRNSGSGAGGARYDIINHQWS